jgi:hypothetical protein
MIEKPIIMPVCHNSMEYKKALYKVCNSQLELLLIRVQGARDEHKKLVHISWKDCLSILKKIITDKLKVQKV